MVVVVVVVEGVVLGDVGVGEARVAALVGKNNAFVAEGQIGRASCRERV